MNSVDRTLSEELVNLVDRLSGSVPEGCLTTISAQRPTLRTRIEEVESRLAAARASILEDYARWRRSLEDLENLWALAAWRSAAEEAPEPVAPLAA